MTIKRWTTLSLFISLVLVRNAVPQSETAKLDAMRARYEEGIRKLAAEHGAEAIRIPAEYTKALTALRTKRQKAGDLDGWQAVDAELRRFSEDRAVSREDVVAADSALAAIQTRYLDLGTRLERRRGKDVLDFVNLYVSHLERHQKALTKNGEFAGAMKVRDEIRRVRDSDEARAAEFVIADSEVARRARAPEPPETEPETRSSLPDGRPGYLKDSPRLEGVSEPLEWQSRRDWETYRGEKTQSFWANVSEGKKRVVWKTQEVNRRDVGLARSVTFVFGGGMGFSPDKTGTWNIEVNGRKALRVKVPVEKSKVWESGDYKLYFEHHGDVHLGYKGIYFLTVPRNVLKMNQTQRIAFLDDAQPDDDGGWVMVNEYTDMTAR